MLYREIIAVCSEIQTKHINTLWGLNLELLNVKLAVPLGFKRLQVAPILSPVLHLVALTPLANLQHFLVYALSLSV